MIKVLNLPLKHLYRIYAPPVIMCVLTIISFIIFIMAVKCYTKEERFQRIDWKMWFIRLIASSLMSLVVILVIVKDKHISVYDYPPTNYLVIEAIFVIIPVNWMILDGSIR